ncbi:hypothetical protein [Pseudonocardia sp. GCM10023141]
MSANPFDEDVPPGRCPVFGEVLRAACREARREAEASAAGAARS